MRAIKKLLTDLRELWRQDPLKLVAALVATIVTIAGLVVRDTLLAILSILVVLDLLAISQLLAGSSAIKLEQRSKDTSERVTRIEESCTETGPSVRRIEASASETLRIVRTFNVEMLDAAKAAGVVDIFAKRKHNDDAITSVKTELERVRLGGGNVDLLGIALPDYLLREPFTRLVNDLVSQASLRALLLDPESDAAIQRAAIEWQAALTLDDIRASIYAIRRFLEGNHDVQGRLYSITPGLFLMITDAHVFIEPYHLGDCGPAVDCIGGRVPFLQVAPVSRLPAHEPDTYKIMRNHFERVWSSASRIEIQLSARFQRGDEGRSLTITRPQEREDKLPLLELDLSYWTLQRAEDSGSEVYTFLPGTVLEPGGHLTVIEGAGTDTSTRKYTHENLWEEGDTLLLRNAAALRRARAKTFRITYVDGA